MSQKKPSAADRPQFRRDVAKMMESLGVQVGEAEPSGVILCTHASDFDPSTNVLWEDKANKSVVRSDVHCSTCKHTVALSNHTYERYRAFDKKPRICCTRCLPSLLKENP